MEKRDKTYCTTIENNRLKSLRLVPDDDEEDFCGFTADVGIINHDKLKIAIIQCAQAVMDSEPIEEIMEHPYLGRIIPDRAPILKENVTKVPEDPEGRSRNSSGASSLDILDLIPEPQEIANKTNTPKKLTYEIREKGTSRGNPVIEDSRGFTYSYQKSSKGKSKPPRYTYWQCIKRQNNAVRQKNKNKINCKCYLKIEKYEEGARNMIVTRMGDGEDHGHNHDQDFGLQIKKNINEELKKEALNHPKAKTADIIKKVLSENGDFNEFYESKSSIPLQKSMARCIQRARRHTHFPSIKDLKFVINREYIYLDNFLRDDVKVKEARHFIFYTNQQLQYMARAFAWYIDGTFKIVKEPIKQLLTIHVILKIAYTRVSVPVCFVLMTRRRKIDYVAIFKKIKEKCNEFLSEKNLKCELKTIMADFEIALWQAIRELRHNNHFPADLEMKGCYFHFTQAVLRKAVQYGLQNEYYKKINSGLRCYIKWLMSLVLLPPDLMQTTFRLMFDKIKEKNCPKLKKLYLYYEKNWINGNNWSIEEICQWKQHIRTNNDAERFHMKLMSTVEKSNVPFYELVNILGDIGRYIWNNAKMFAQGLIGSYQKKEAKSFEQTLTKASNLLQNNKITPIQFLNLLSSSSHDNQIITEKWIENSRVDCWPEMEIEENDAISENEEYDSSDSEYDYE